MSELVNLAETLVDHHAYAVSYYATAALVAGWFKYRRHLPHHHDSYVAMNGYVHNCSLCDKAPRDLDHELAEVRAYIAEHPWAGPYMGPDAEWRKLADLADAEYAERQES